MHSSVLCQTFTLNVKVFSYTITSNFVSAGNIRVTRSGPLFTPNQKLEGLCNLLKTSQSQASPGKILSFPLNSDHRCHPRHPDYEDDNTKMARLESGEGTQSGEKIMILIPRQLAAWPRICITWINLLYL